MAKEVIQFDVSYPIDCGSEGIDGFFEIEEKIKQEAGRFAQITESGAGFGSRDLTFEAKSEWHRERAVEIIESILSSKFNKDSFYIQ